MVAGDAPSLAASADRFEAMGAMLLAAEAAAQEAALHAAAGRKGSAATARGRAAVLMGRCEGARTPGLLDLGVDPAMATLTDREREVVRLAASGLTNRDILGGQFHDPGEVLASVAWSIGIVAVFAPLAVHVYLRST